MRFADRAGQSGLVRGYENQLNMFRDVTLPQHRPLRGEGSGDCVCLQKAAIIQRRGAARAIGFLGFFVYDPVAGDEAREPAARSPSD